MEEVKSILQRLWAGKQKGCCDARSIGNLGWLERRGQGIHTGLERLCVVVITVCSGNSSVSCSISIILRKTDLDGIKL